MKETIVHPGILIDTLEVVETSDPDTSLHIMGGPASETPQWVFEGWMRAAEKRRAEAVDSPAS